MTNNEPPVLDATTAPKDDREAFVPLPRGRREFVVDPGQIVGSVEYLDAAPDPLRVASLEILVASTVVLTIVNEREFANQGNGYGERQRPQQAIDRLAKSIEALRVALGGGEPTGKDQQ